MPPMIVMVDKYKDVEWFIVVDSAFKSLPILGRSNAAGMVRYVVDERARAAFYKARDLEGMKARVEANQVISLAWLEKVTQDDAWFELRGRIDNWHWRRDDEVAATSEFHEESDSEVYSIEAYDAYLVVTPIEKLGYQAVVTIGAGSAREAIARDWANRDETTSRRR